VAALATTLTLGAASAGDAADVAALLAELEQLPDEVLQSDPALWQEVLTLLQQVARTQQPAPRAEALRLSAAAADASARFPAVYQQIAAELRSGTGDLAGRVLQSGFGAGRPTLEDLAAQAGVALPDRTDLALGMRKVEAVNALTPNAQPLTEGMRDNIAQLTLRGARHGQELMKLQGTGREMAARLARLDGLVQRATALTAPESLADDVDVSQLRAEFSALRVAQQEAFAALGGHLMPAAPGQLQAPRSATSPRINRNAIAADLSRQIQALQDAGGDVRRLALHTARCELYLAALDALNGEEQVKAAALLEGAQQQAQLMQVSAEARRLAEMIDRASAR
jgi:hypothetical protein